MNQLKYPFPVWLAPLLLSVIAINQQIRSNFQSLSPWKGGGFGMFSSSDSPDSRLIFIYLQTPDELIPVSCPKELKLEYGRIRTFPEKNRINKFIRKLIDFDWRDYGIIMAYMKKEIDGNEGVKQGTDDVFWRNSIGVVQDEKNINYVRFVGIDAKRYKNLPTGKPLVIESIRVEIWNLSTRDEGANLKKLIEMTVTR